MVGKKVHLQFVKPFIAAAAAVESRLIPRTNRLSTHPTSVCLSVCRSSKRPFQQRSLSLKGERSREGLLLDYVGKRHDRVGGRGRTTYLSLPFCFLEKSSCRPAPQPATLHTSITSPARSPNSSSWRFKMPRANRAT